MARLTITDNFADLAEMIDRMEGDLRMAVTEALETTQRIVQGRTSSAAGIYAGRGRKGYATGSMYASIPAVDNLKWEGDAATIGVGFKLPAGGGWHSIFVMYGTPTMAKDTAVYNAIKGAQTLSAIEQAQEAVLRKYAGLGG